MGGQSLPGPGELAEARAACAQLAAMPNPPMSADACRAMVDMATRMDAATDDPSARRPGDDALTCAAIFAELQGVAGVGISAATRDRAATLSVEGEALANRQAGELSAFMVETQAMGMAAGAIGAVTPNFVGAAIAAAWQARLAAFAASNVAAQAPLRAQTSDVVRASMEELNQSIMANPRFARLGQLAMQKQCEPPVDARP